jgi:solute carrier family 13 (sodium-dependent dicarboxylate transporter), member 2/3/5
MVGAVAATPSLSEAEARFDAMRQRVGLIAAPLVLGGLLWLPMPSLSPQAHALAAVAAMTVILWVTEAIPLAAAALLGPALAALLGVADARTAFAPFADPLMFLFLGGFVLAGALSRHGFDRRSALWLVSRRIVAGSPTRALVAICAISFAFSMWISNTATTAMLIPVALGVHATMRESVGSGDPSTLRQLDRFGGGMCLTMAYASSLGGVATPIGTGTNVIAIGMLEEHAGVRIDFAQWMTFGFPIGLALTVAVVWLAVRRFRPPLEQVDGLTEAVTRQLRTLGPLKPAELRSVLVFGLAVVGWLAPSAFRLTLGRGHPVSTWAASTLDEGVVAMVCAILLFFVPSGEPPPKGRRVTRLLDWSIARRIDWGAWFLLGGGLALGKLTFDTGLADAIGRGLLGAAGPMAAHPLGLTAAAALLMIFMTEVTSNTATASMMLPVIIGIAQASGIDPTQTAVTVTIAASCAFMLPVSTPPNAMAYGTGMIRIDTMVSFGFRLDLVTYVILVVAAAVALPFLL